ncbi:Na(+)/H(+) antiporter subunit B [Sanguibacter sp. Z1732]|uniref:Na(+)/H(+) antiporter subunit B n=1 Tax=Sanguibacter sp. Z1732 TaxID=3435412 RepID=UPI003D9C8BA7
MEAVGAFDVVLAVGLFAVAGYALFGRSRVHAAAMFLVFGVLLAVSWAWLHAPDVAIAEAVLGAGVTGVLVMNAVTATPEPPRALAGAGHRPGPWYGLLGGALARCWRWPCSVRCGSGRPSPARARWPGGRWRQPGCRIR